jgi:hypothetical protein
MERVEQGILVRLPRSEFENRVQKAARGQAPKPVPRLIEARYRATLIENGGLVGTGQWKIINPGTGPVLLPLQPFNLALQQPRFENREALVADFDGKGPALLVEEGGEQSVAIEWSARADARPEGLYFSLELPAAPVAFLELELPADREPSSVGSAVVAGPYPSEAPDRRLWKIACGGRPGINLWVRRVSPVLSSGPSLFVHQHAVQTLLPEGLSATYQLEMEATRPGVRLLVCEVDADLRPTEIEITNLEKSDLRVSPNGGPSQLFLVLREPLPVGQEVLQLRCLAPLGAIKPAPAREGRVVDWTSPGLRLTQVGFQADKVDPLARVVPRGETLEIRCHPDVCLSNWMSGGFRITDAASRVEPDPIGTLHVLTLQGGGVESEGTPVGKPPRRPSARLRLGGVDFRARQVAWWQIGDDRMSLTLQITYDVNYGQLFQLPIHLPPDWEIERVELNPSDRLRNWNVRPEKDGSTLLVELQRPITAADDFRRDKSAATDGAVARLRGPSLTVRLNASRREGLTGRAWPFPDAAPIGARLREGALGVDLSDLLYQGSLRSTLAESEPGEEEGLWGSQTPDHYFSYRGQALQGTLELRPRAAKVRATCTTNVHLASDRVDTRLVLEAEAGSVDAVDLYVSTSWSEPAQWRVESGNNQLRRAERVSGDEVLLPAALVAARGLPGIAGALGARQRGEYWRLVFTRPLVGRNALVLHASRRLGAHEGHWEAPLPLVLNASRMEGEVTLHLAGGNRLPLETAGLREVVPTSPAPARGKSATAWRTFRYGAAAGLLLRGPMPPRLGGAAVTVERADLTTFLQTDGGLEHHLSFRLANWPGPTLSLPLPPGSRLISARVDGHWLVRPVFTDDAAGNHVLELPAPAGTDGSDSAHYYEVIYAVAGHSWMLWTQVDAARPTLPAEPLAYRHTWRLPPGVSPLFEEKYHRVPGPGEGFEPVEPGRLSQQMRPLLRSPLWPASSEEAVQRQALADAVQAARRRNAGHTLSLGEVAEQIAAELAKDGWTLVVDAEALRAAGLTPQTRLAVKALASADDQATPWEGLGLTAAPAGSAVMLTTDRQLGLWREAMPASGVPDGVARAVSDAVENGQDASGRFRAVLASGWLVAASDEVGSPIGGEALAEWTAWEGVPGIAGSTSLVVVRGETALRAGLSVSWLVAIGLAAVLGMVGYATRRWGRWRLAPLLGWSGLTGLGVLLLPAALQYLAWGPLVAGGIISLVWYLGSAVMRRPPASPPDRVVRSTAAVVIGLVLLPNIVGPAGRAAPPTPGAVAVFVVPGPEDAPEKQSVLAPAGLLEQLDALGRSPLATGVVLVSAIYEGKVVDNVADFDATFAVHSLGAEKATLTLPLDGVQLYGELWLDGAAAQVAALPAPQVGYSIQVSGRGRHKVEVHFRVPVTSAADEHNVQFTAPRLMQNRLRLKLPKEAAYMQAPVRYGAERVPAEDGSKVLDVDLGRVAASVQVRWFQATGAARPANVEFKEAYFWDLRPDAATLNALLHYDITDSAVTALTVFLPADLEVRNAEARRILSANGPNGAVRLRDFTVDAAANPRALELHFGSPVRGEVQVQLDLVPAAPLPATVTLPVPIPQGTPHSKGSYLAYRVQGLEATRTNYLRVSGVPLGEFAPFWPGGSRPDALTDAYVFRREGGQGPVVTVRLRPQAVVRASQEVAIRVGTQQARVHATVDLSAATKALAFVEWDIQSPQPFTVAAVTGPDVRGWTQTNNRVQVWLDHAAKETRLELFGWMPLLRDDQRLRLELPNLRVFGGQPQQTAVRLSAAAGWGFAQAQPRNLSAAAAPTGADQELTYLTDRADYGGTFFVQPGLTGPEVQALTIVEVRDGRLLFTTTLDYQARGSEIRTVNLRLSDWDGEDVRLDAPRVATRRERRRAADDRTWSLSLQPGATGAVRTAWALAAGPAARLATHPAGGHYRCTLSGSMPLTDAGGGVRMPNVAVTGAGPAEYWLAVGGKELTSDAAAGLIPLTLPAQSSPAWREELARLVRDGGRAWKVAAPVWKLRVSPRSASSEPGPVVIFLTKQTAAVSDEQRWLHAAAYTFRHEAGGELNVTMPEGAHVVSAALNGVPLAQLLTDSPRLALPLPNRAGVGRLNLRWAYDAGGERLTAPNLDRPRLDGARDGPVLYTVLAPPGFEPGPGTRELKAGLPRAAALDMAEASAQLGVSTYLAGQRAATGLNDAAELAESQQRFAGACRQAKRIVEANGHKGDPDKVALAEEVQALEKTNRDQARLLGYDDIRVEAERQTWSATRALLSEQGLPLYTVATPDQAVPSLPLQNTWGRQLAQRQVAAVAWLMMLAVVGLLACFRGVVSVVQWFWPEQMALVGAATWFLAGPTLLGLLLVALGLAARGVYLLVGMRRLLIRPMDKPAASSQANSGKRSGT